jgi:pimeloyl-ACP methyl ester carboxylesterase
LDAMVLILEENSIWHPWKLTTNTSVVVMGHSNGGQGAWYLASRYPDRVIGGLYI